MPDTATIRPFAGKLRRFWLPLPQVIELERKTGRAVFAVYDALAAGAASIDDALEVVRLGHEGGSRSDTASTDAAELIAAHAYPLRPAIEAMSVAWLIISAAIGGIRLSRQERGKPSKPQPLVKGQLIANCGGMHLDWERLSLSGYFEGLESHNAMHSQESAQQRPPSHPDRLRRFVDAHWAAGRPIETRRDMLDAVMAARAGHSDLPVRDRMGAAQI